MIITEKLAELTQFIQSLSKKEFQKYLLIAIASVAVIALGATYYVYSTSSSLVQEIKKMNRCSHLETLRKKAESDRKIFIFFMVLLFAHLMPGIFKHSGPGEFFPLALAASVAFFVSSSLLLGAKILDARDETREKGEFIKDVVSRLMGNIVFVLFSFGSSLFCLSKVFAF